jgi:hypothetical protein
VIAAAIKLAMSEKPAHDDTSEELRRTAKELFEESHRLREQAERLRQQAETISRAVAARDNKQTPPR